LQGIEAATEKDIAGQIIQFMEKRVAETAGKKGRTRTQGKG
jgi:hypothetical protein